MLSPLAVSVAILAYCALLLLAARATERASGKGVGPADNPWVYSLTLAVYCTSWTYFGSVGKAATSGLLFLTIYLGPTICILTWWVLLRKLVRIKEARHITSIADFISARYDRSQWVAAVATLIAVLGITPYVALQLKSLTTTFFVLTGKAGEDGFLRDNLELILVGLLAVFTIYYGARRLDPTERHQGMMMVVAVECVVKLAAFLLTGVFVTYFMFDGFGDVLARAQALGHMREALPSSSGHSPHILWITYMVLSASAIVFLPRQFHVSVVENSNERHILTAMWVFPLYMLLINVFVVPIAAAGLALGFPAAGADTFVLTLPMSTGKGWMALLVFLGGFSAATGMAIVATMTVSTMMTNHFVVPVAQRFSPLSFLRGNLLRCRWGAMVLVLLLGYLFERAFGGSYMLVNMGILSFAAVFQFAPVILGGLFWRRANKTGALWGMSLGLLGWAYALILPVFVREGFLSSAILEAGPFGIGWLHPEHLFGLTALDSLSHGVFWSLVLNVGGFVTGSILTEQSGEEHSIADEFVDVLRPAAALPHAEHAAPIEISQKISLIRTLLSEYFSPEKVDEIIETCLRELSLPRAGGVGITDLMGFYSLAQSQLAGALGTAGAYKVLQDKALLTDAERTSLGHAYAEILADMKLGPQELRTKVDYYREREALLTRTSKELEDKVAERDSEISERRRVEETLRLSEERQRLLLDASPEPIISYDIEHRATYVNPAFEATYGWTRAEVLGNALGFIVPHGFATQTDELFKRIRDNGKVIGFETRRVTKYGKVLEVIISAAALKDAQGNTTGTILFHRDVTEKKQAEETIKRLASAVDQAAEVVVITGTDGKVQYVNPAFSGMTGVGLKDVTNLLQLSRIIHVPVPLPELRDTLERGETWKGTARIKRPDGPPGEAECTASPVKDEAGNIVNYVAVCRDVTTQRRIETLLQQSQKMDAIGTLAGGIAHDFNNILQPLLGYAELAKEQVAPNPVASEYINNIIRAALRARALVGQILAFARRAEQERKPLDLKSLLQETVQFLRASIPSTVEIRLNIDAKSTGVLADANQINQVLINLCTNASQAMGEKGGTLSLSLSELDVAESNIPMELSGKKTGHYLVLSVADTGLGMSPEVRSRIFEPFFTTKPKGEGTGLGLSVVHGIVENHGGAISVWSEPEKGSTFTVYLPRIELVEEVEAPKPKTVPTGNEEILFVDDEAPIRELSAESLSTLGYRVTTAANAQEALKIFSAEPERFKLVVTDFTMPGMNGLEMAKRILALKPGIPIILCSGFTPSLTPEKVKETGICRFLYKPLTLKELAETMSQCLHG